MLADRSAHSLQHVDQDNSIFNNHRSSDGYTSGRFPTCVCVCACVFLFYLLYLQCVLLQPYRMFTSSSDEDLLLAVEEIEEHEGVRTPRRNRLDLPRADEQARRTPGANRPVTPRPPSPDLFSSPEARHGLSSPAETRSHRGAGFSNSYLMESGAILQTNNVGINVENKN